MLVFAFFSAEGLPTRAEAEDCLATEGEAGPPAVVEEKEIFGFITGINFSVFLLQKIPLARVGGDGSCNEYEFAGCKPLRRDKPALFVFHEVATGMDIRWNADPVSSPPGRGVVYIDHGGRFGC